MTDVEKKLNREDLIAYKKYDNTQYALIPGFNNQRKFMDPEIYQPKGAAAKGHEEQQKRLYQQGYNRE